MRVSVFFRRALPVGAAFAVLLGTAHCTSLLGDFDAGTGGEGPDSSLTDGSSSGGSSSGGPSGDSGPLTNEAGVLLGTACTSTADCKGGPCSDGVCCDTVCDGVCMRCDVGAAKGTCTPVPAMTDPDKECLMAAVTVVDAGPVADAAPSDGGDAGDDAAMAASADAGIADAATDGQVPEAGPVINYPDSGLMPDGGACAGSCDGHGACKFPAVETSCGTPFCNDDVNLARVTCDGTGRCQNIDVEPCKDYSCTGNACKSTCQTQADCQESDRCLATGCVPKLSNGIACTLPTDCESGNCVGVSSGGSVCCNSPCSGFGGNCAASASTTGQCTCPSCAGGGACAVFYPDNDNDGYGDKTATVVVNNPTASNAVVACAGTPPAHSAAYPANYYVADHTDCSDSDPSTHPGATYSSSPVVGGTGAGGFDHDCDGAIVQQFRTYPSTTTCHVCSATAPTCATSSCGASGAESYGTLSCEAQYGNCCSCFVILNPPIGTQPISTQSLINTNQSINPDLIGPIRECCACTAQTCGPNDTTGFIANSGSTPIACGQEGEFLSCGSCSGTTLGATAYTYPLQGCK